MTDEKTPHLLIRVDATRETGLGHAMRCLAVAEAWRDRGGRVTVWGTVEGPSGLVRGWFEAAGVEVMHPAYYDDLGAYVAAEAPDALVVDGYGLDAPSDARDVPTVLMCGERLRGPAAPLRRAVRCAQSDPPPPTARCWSCPPRIVVATGGADHGGLASRLAWALRGVAARHGAEVLVVAGPWCGLATEPPAVRVPLCARVVRAPDAGAWADLLTAPAPTVCVTAGGTTLWELAYLGVPAVAVEVAANQRGNLRDVERAGCAVATVPSCVPLAVDALLSFPAWHERVSAAGPTYMGAGDGADRLVERLWPAAGG